MELMAGGKFFTAVYKHRPRKKFSLCMVIVGLIGAAGTSSRLWIWHGDHSAISLETFFFVFQGTRQEASC